MEIAIKIIASEINQFSEKISKAVIIMIPIKIAIVIIK